MSQLLCWQAVSGRQTLALLLRLRALRETEAYLQDKVFSSARFVENVTFGISGATYLVLTLIKSKMLWPECESAFTGLPHIPFWPGVEENIPNAQRSGDQLLSSPML